jgi:WhiB family redox-sensing transcriptional regulator
VSPFVAAGRAREHARILLRSGLTAADIAGRAGLPRSVVHRLLGSCCGYSRARRIRPATEDAILAVHPDPPETTGRDDHVDPEPWWLGLSPPPGDLDLTWRARARCTDPEVPTRFFFPGRGDIETSKLAQAFCAECPVREPCLEFALATDALGIWGGTTELHRQKMTGRRQDR